MDEATGAMICTEQPAFVASTTRGEAAAAPVGRRQLGSHHPADGEGGCRNWTDTRIILGIQLSIIRLTIIPGIPDGTGARKPTASR